MIRTIFAGVTTAYMAKAVQMLVQFLIVPFLISNKQLGLSGYGFLFSILSLQFLLGMFTDGMRLSISKNVSKCINNPTKQFRLLIVATLFIFILSLTITTIALIGKNSIINIFGLNSIPDIKLLYFLICLSFLVEQTFYPIETVLHSKGKTWVVNLSISGEVVIRALIVFYIFTFYTASIKIYLGIFLSCLCLRKIFIGIIALKNQTVCSFGDIKQLRDEIKIIIKDALFLSFNGVSSVLIYRVSILLANKFISPEAAGLLSILVINIRGYIVQGLISMLHPMLIPLTASLKLNSLDSVKREKIKAALGTYQLIVCLICIAIGFSSSIWLRLWLGNSAVGLIDISQVFIIAIGLEIAFSIHGYLLISQGYGAYLSVINATFSIIFCSLMLVMFYFKMNIHQLVYLISFHCLLNSSIVVQLLFHKKMRNISLYKSPSLGLWLSILIASIPFVFIKTLYPSPCLQWQLISVAISLILFLLSFHYIFFSLNRIKHFLLSSASTLMNS